MLKPVLIMKHKSIQSTITPAIIINYVEWLTYLKNDRTKVYDKNYLDKKETIGR